MTESRTMPPCLMPFWQLNRLNGHGSLNATMVKVENCKKSFNAFIFVMAWLNAQKAADAPVNDLLIRESLNLYEKNDSRVARAAFLPFSRHLCY
ncbi:hypothetical protein AVEN_214076-1 [Araneus ventricosus]|uniref:Uncharacterized protein n=1 Tax=Araneus ventricosus TaxID=182803 RepID=A0A4Y2NJ19_ARAVE|nr:hypothetical protein AVEN_214076-1 [Araneus ventricosus]